LCWSPRKQTTPQLWFQTVSNRAQESSGSAYGFDQTNPHLYGACTLAKTFPRSKATSAKMVNLVELFHQKMELLRLEKKYIHGRRRRSHFVSEAIYVDGEYLYEQPSQSYTSSSKPTSSSSKNSRSSSSLGSTTTVSAPDFKEKSEGKRMSWSGNWGRRKGNAEAEKRRELMVSVKEVTWEDSKA